MPAPTDVGDIQGLNPKTEEPDTRQAGDDEPFAALAFKIMNDAYTGKLVYFRVYSGKAVQGTTALNPRTGKRERFGRLLQMHSNHRENRDEIYSGDIAAAVGLKNVATGDTLCSADHPIVLESLEFPEPVISMAIEPKSNADRDKLTDGLTHLVQEDPTFQVRTDDETGQTVVSAMGELHLEIIKDRLMREFKVEANIGNPQVSYREKLLAEAKADAKFVRQTGGRGQYGHAIINVTPMEQGHGVTVESKVVGGRIPQEYIPAVENGIREAAAEGVLAGYPLVDIHVDIMDGSFHPVDSSEMAFKIAGSMALKDAARKGEIALMEPIMKVEVTVPEENMGDVIGDVASRRGSVSEMNSHTQATVILAEVPLERLFGYASDLRTVTSGRASFVAEPLRFEQVPKDIQEKILKDMS
jgi:elongation factor G